MLNQGVSEWPSYTPEEIDAVGAVLRSNRVNYWTGDLCRQFESRFAEYVGTRHAVAVANGTLALDLALRTARVGPGDEVVVTPRTFIASVSSVVNAGATPVFADVDLDSGNISPGSIAEVLSERTRAIVPVHLAGWPCDMTGMMALAEQHDLVVIEDCAQAHGATHRGRQVGSWGQFGAWSFCQDKIITTGGEGGMVTTDDEAAWEAMWAYKDHGKSFDAVYRREHEPGFRWLHESFGTNWRMLEVQAAIGLIQLDRLPEWLDRRRAIAKRYAEAAAEFPSAVRVPEPGPEDRHAYYRQYAYVRPEGLARGWSRDRIIAECVAKGSPLFQGSCSEVYLEKAFEGTRLQPPQRLPNAIALGQTSLMFLTHPTLTDAEVDRICEVFGEVMREAAA
jgi:dTDP-4-amino-4,6-dideoxygalactose transaminase